MVFKVTHTRTHTRARGVGRMYNNFLLYVCALCVCVRASGCVWDVFCLACLAKRTMRMAKPFYVPGEVRLSLLNSRRGGPNRRIRPTDGEFEVGGVEAF